MPTKSISRGAQYVICTVKLDEEKLKHAGLAQKNDFAESKTFREGEMKLLQMFVG
jgi:hypothetical protein